VDGRHDLKPAGEEWFGGGEIVARAEARADQVQGVAGLDRIGSACPLKHS
jgi:hypothetical protein